MEQEAMMVAAHVKKVFRGGDVGGRPVLEDVDFTLRTGEIVACLGKSGSGKSTFLRILAGLIPATGGNVTYKGEPVSGPQHGVGMVFQSFALFPWLTVLGNVELGLEAQRIPPGERRKRALAAIDLIGLDGFESAYPKELSGGMRQRVGFARALVINPEVLLLDEPFSALDVLTAETLRGDLTDLWAERRIPTKSILVVSHNIEEAVEMADRIIIFSSNPGRIQVEIQVAMPRPRDWNSPEFRKIVDEVYGHLTTGHIGKRGVKAEQISLGYRLPDAPVQQLAGLIETLMESRFDGKADLPALAEYQSLDVDDLFPLIEALQLLGFANVDNGDIALTPAGRVYGDANLLKRKQILAEQLKLHIPLAAHIRKVLEERPNHRAPAARFLAELEDHLEEDDAANVLDTVINWGRHAELYAYDYDTETVTLEDPDGQV
ncbi:MAG: nitrate/sulfonate/bicarbonate ABC transporter ATP-binding protein [Aliidongia sp.]